MKTLPIFFRIVFLPAFLFTNVFFVGAQTMPMNMTPPADTTPVPDTTAPPEDMTPAMPEGPAVGNVSVTDITDTSARIEVNSDEVVQGYVEYGTTEQYGMSTPLTSEFSTSPSFVLENLTPETLYHYRVIVMDAGGNATITADETFTTLATPEEPAPPPSQNPATTTSPNSNTATTTTPTNTATTTTTHTPTASTTPEAPPPAPTPPVISNVLVSAVGTSTATVSWTTSKPTTSDIQFGPTTSYGFSVGKNTMLNTSHTRTISNLTASTLYHFRIIVADSANNTVLGKDRTFTTTGASTGSAGNTSSSSTPPPAVPAVPTQPTTSTPATPPPVIESDSDSAVILSKIAEQELVAADAASQGIVGGGLPTLHVPPLLLKLTPFDGQVSFEWRKARGGVPNNKVRTIIVKKQGTSAVKSRIDGKIIYDGPATTFTDTKVQNGKEYHYALYSYGAFGRFTFPARFKVIPRAGVEEVSLSAAEAGDDASEEVSGGVVNKVPAALSLTLPRNLFVGRKGEDVAMLQKVLADRGLYPEALLTGHFGSLTRAAVIRFQILNNISPALGFVGPLTRDALAQ